MKTKSHAPAVFLLALALATAITLRFAVPETRPMHVDEAVQTYIFADLLEHSDYRYDPAHYHGPLPHFINLPLMRLLGIEKLDTLQTWQFRIQPALAGVALVLLVMFAAGRRADVRWRAAALAGVSPLLVYFSRMAIHETLLACGALAVPLAAARWLDTRRARWLVATGVAFGCMHATKETWCIIAFSWVVAALLVSPRMLWNAVRAAGATRIALVAAVAMTISFLLYSGGGRHPEGFADAWRTLFAYRTGGGHEKPWFYYLSEIFGFHQSGGWIWGEGIVVVLAIAGGAAALWKKTGHAYRARESRVPVLPRFLAISAVAQIAVYSIIKYKTPWLALVPAASLVPLAAHGWPRFQGGARRWAFAAACSVAIAGFALIQTWKCAFERPTDSAIPVVYAPTLPAADHELARVASELPEEARVAVIGDDYWPLPWYFRARRQNTVYLSDAEAHGLTEADLQAYALVIRAGYQLEPEVLRAGFLALDLRPGYYVSVRRNSAK